MARVSIHVNEPAAPLDPRDPDHSRSGIFVNHNCWRCNHGAKACVERSPNLCGNPRARND